jgi:hypothetical protein
LAHDEALISFRLRKASVMNSYDVTFYTYLKQLGQGEWHSDALHRCPVFEMAREMGVTELMYHHTCCTDECIASAFNPQIGFRRTKTLMQGDDCCDHYYFLK